jgi:rSAM/selenodomain-associated transferase 2
MKQSLSIIIPALNCAAFLEQNLPAALALADEVIVCDAASSDNSPVVAKRLGACVIEAQPGRGTQLAAGAKAACGSWLLFLHADSHLSDDCAEVIKGFIASDENLRRAGFFRLAFDDASPKARRLERLVRWRCKFLGLPYGDQGLLIERRFYDAIGGFKPIPLMEDVDIVRRIGKAHMVCLDATVVTSARRYQKSGYILRSLRNLFCLGLYFVGAAPKTIAKIYR